MKRVDFLNPAFQNGINSTVRLGDRSGSYYNGQFLALYKTGDTHPVAYATVMKVLVMPYNQLCVRYIYAQHDEETRTLEGLWSAMVRAYGDNMKPDSIITLIFFEIDEWCDSKPSTMHTLE